MYVKKNEPRILQGDFIEAFLYESSRVVDGALETTTVTFPYAVVLTQDCDLEWDYKNREDQDRKNNDKYLQSILICPAYLAESLRTGSHLDDLHLKMEPWLSDLWKHIKRNQNERFYFLDKYEQAMPDLVLDFKHFYTFPREKLYEIHKTNYKISLDVPFREDLSQRFSNYLSRIGLPVVPARGATVDVQPV
jgi:hypothetical protein